MNDFPYDENYVNIIFFASGLLWIPYSALLLYCYYEHRQRKKFPQDMILLLLFISAVIRCIWFFTYYHYSTYLTLIIMNRLAILLQFAAISVLMTMWMRALIITSIADRMTLRTSSVSLPNASSTNAVGIGTTQEQITNERTSSMSSERVKELSLKHHQALVSFETERQQRAFVHRTIWVNIVVWAAILGTLGQRTDYMYSINLICIALLCLLEALVTLMIGFRVASLLQRELQPVFVNNRHSSPSVSRPSDKEVSVDLQKNDEASGATSSMWSWLVIHTALRCCFCSCQELLSLYRILYSSDRVNRSLQLQRDVLKTIINVTLVVFVFFLLRSLCFSFSPIFHISTHGDENAGFLNNAYPWFFYELPELLPNLAIAVGVSPPNGLLRRMYFHMLYNYYYCKFYFHVYILGDKAYCPNDVLDRADAERSGAGERGLGSARTGDEYAAEKTRRSTMMSVNHSMAVSPNIPISGAISSSLHPPTRRNSAGGAGDAGDDDEDDMSKYYIEHPPERPGQQSTEPRRTDSGVIRTAIPFMRFFLRGSPANAETATPSSSPAAAFSLGSRSRYASRDEWLSSRHESQEYAELLYKIHSFSTLSALSQKPNSAVAGDSQSYHINEGDDSFGASSPMGGEAANNPLHEDRSSMAVNRHSGWEAMSFGWSSWKSSSITTSSSRPSSTSNVPGSSNPSDVENGRKSVEMT